MFKKRIKSVVVPAHEYTVTVIDLKVMKSMQL